MNLSITNLNLQAAQQLRAGPRLVRKVMRRAALTYLGLWGMAYDKSLSLVADSRQLVDQAEQRGEQILIKLHVVDQPDVSRKAENTPPIQEPTVVEIAISGYAKMNVKTATTILPTLTLAQLQTLREHEATTRNRITLLRAMDEQIKRLLTVE